MNKPEENSFIDLETVQGFVLGALVLIWLVTVVLLWRSPVEVPIFFSKPYGEDQLAVKWWLLSFPVLSTLIYLSVFFIKNKVKSSPISTSMTIWMSLGSLALMLLAEIFIATLVF